MLDFVFAVDDPVTWHTMNLIENRKHYSLLKYLGPKQISNIQNDYGAGIYFNTLVPADDQVKHVTTALICKLIWHWVFQVIERLLHIKQKCVHWFFVQFGCFVEAYILLWLIFAGYKVWCDQYRYTDRWLISLEYPLCGWQITQTCEYLFLQN